MVSIPVEGEHTSFRVNIQHFEREKVLFMVAAGYMELEAATSSNNMVLLLTQLAALNYELLIGKFQLNPTTGAITLSAEINLDDGMGFQTFQSVLGHLIQTADAQYPTLHNAPADWGCEPSRIGCTGQSSHPFQPDRRGPRPERSVQAPQQLPRSAGARRKQRVRV